MANIPRTTLQSGTSALPIDRTRHDQHTVECHWSGKARLEQEEVSDSGRIRRGYTTEGETIAKEGFIDVNLPHGGV